jgi:hypothetical protein
MGVILATVKGRITAGRMTALKGMVRVVTEVSIVDGFSLI